MKQLLKKQRKITTVLTWTLWIPVILFCSYLIVELRASSIISFFILALILFFILIVIGKISGSLEKVNAYPRRIFKQFLYGFLMPSLSLITIIVLYDKFFNNEVVPGLHLLNELIIVITYLYVVNSFFLVIDLDKQFSFQILPIVHENHFHEKVVVYNKGEYGQINLMEIALIDQQNQINWLITFKEERHILDLPLKTITEILGVEHFFKINRCQIVHKQAINTFRSGSFGKIDLLLHVNEVKATVSKDRAKEFRQWFNH